MKILTKKCIVCGKEFARIYKNRKFCSRNCYYKWQKKNPNKGCFKNGNTKGFQERHPIFGGVKSRFKKGQIPWNKNIHIQTNNALKIWNKNKGIPWMKGTHIKTNDALDKWRNKGNAIRGKSHWNWQGGISKLRERIETLPEYKKWRMAVFMRDNFACKKCGKKGKIHPHHKKGFSQILKENYIRTIKQARNCKKLWNINNGQTLCIPCHKQTFSYLRPRSCGARGGNPLKELRGSPCFISGIALNTRCKISVKVE